MPYFSEIVAATQDAAGGTLETEATLNTSFGIKASAAKVANIDAKWLSQQTFLVKASYA